MNNKLNNIPQYSTCLECVYETTCPRYTKCSFLLRPNHTNNQEEIEFINNLKKGITPFAGGEFSSARKSPYASSDSRTTLFSYHKDIVNDALKIIRKGGTAYVYTEQILKDVLSFEPKASVYVQDKIFYIKIC